VKELSIILKKAANDSTLISVETRDNKVHSCSFREAYRRQQDINILWTYSARPEHSPATSEVYDLWRMKLPDHFYAQSGLLRSIYKPIFDKVTLIFPHYSNFISNEEGFVNLVNQLDWSNIKKDALFRAIDHARTIASTYFRWRKEYVAKQWLAAVATNYLIYYNREFVLKSFIPYLPGDATPEEFAEAIRPCLKEKKERNILMFQFLITTLVSAQHIVDCNSTTSVCNLSIFKTEVPHSIILKLQKDKTKYRRQLKEIDYSHPSYAYRKAIAKVSQEEGSCIPYSPFLVPSNIPPSDATIVLLRGRKVRSQKENTDAPNRTKNNTHNILSPQKLIKKSKKSALDRTVSWVRCNYNRVPSGHKHALSNNIIITLINSWRAKNGYERITRKSSLWHQLRNALTITNHWKLAKKNKK